MELEKFKIVVIPLREKLQSFARNILKDETEAEDAVQETYLKLWRIKDQLDNHPNVGGYAMQTLKNICIDRLRVEKHNIPLDNISIAEGTLTPYMYTEQQDNASIIRNIIESLPNTQKRIIKMRDIEGFELAEIAHIMGSEESAVRVNLSRARKMVRDSFLKVSNSYNNK